VRTIRLFVLPAALAVMFAVAATAIANGGKGFGGFDNKFKGTDANDTFAGTAGKDLAIGRKGDDNLAGAEERDWLFGGDGNDTLSGGPGNDKADGGRGEDTVNGDAGNDWLWGGADNDVVNGGDDNDKLGGGGGDDTLDGGSGDDVIVSAGLAKKRFRGRGCDKGRNFGCDKGRNFGKRGKRGRKSWRWTVDPQGKDTITCGEGADKVYADKDDVVAADCETVVRLEDKMARKNKRR
jgi:Ca2+-binding RTX toxin-like protein